MHSWFRFPMNQKQIDEINPVKDFFLTVHTLLCNYQGLMQMCDQLKEEKESLIKQHESNGWSVTAEIAAAQEKQMEVCKVCGAFLIVGDAQQRIDDHLTGKQHLG